MLKNLPLSVYIHLPWCVHKCPYCDFNSHEMKNSSFVSDKKNYLNAILQQINLIETDKDVTIITEKSKTTGIGMSADLDAGLIVLLENAKREVKDEEGIRIIQGNKMIYNTNTNEWIVDNSSGDVIKEKIKKKVTTTFNIK